MAGIFWPIWRAEGYTIELEDLSNSRAESRISPPRLDARSGRTLFLLGRRWRLPV